MDRPMQPIPQNPGIVYEKMELHWRPVRPVEAYVEQPRMDWSDLVTTLTDVAFQTIQAAPHEAYKEGTVLVAQQMPQIQAQLQQQQILQQNSGVMPQLHELQPPQANKRNAAPTAVKKRRVVRAEDSFNRTKPIILDDNSSMGVADLATKVVKREMCHYCNKEFNAAYLVDHLRMHTGEKPFVCDYCSKAFRCKGDWKKHRRIHTNERPYVCKQCNAGFKQKVNLIRHMVRHTGQKLYHCDFCGKDFKSLYGMQMHRRSHLGEGTFECKDCGERFVKKARLDRHMLIHSGEEVFQCDQCRKIFTKAASLEAHKNRHQGETGMLCEHCGRYFSRKDVLLTHVHKEHGKDKLIECSECQKVFVCPEDLTNHSIVHMNGQCPLCDKHYEKRHKLKIHLATHNLIKPPGKRGPKPSAIPKEPKIKRPRGRPRKNIFIAKKLIEKRRRCLLRVRIPPKDGADKPPREKKTTSSPVVSSPPSSATKSNSSSPLKPIPTTKISLASGKLSIMPQPKLTSVTALRKPSERHSALAKKCCFCNKVLANSQELKQHYATHSRPTKGFKYVPASSRHNTLLRHVLQRKVEKRKAVEGGLIPDYKHASSSSTGDSITSNSAGRLALLISKPTLQRIGWPDRDLDGTLKQVVERAGFSPIGGTVYSSGNDQQCIKLYTCSEYGENSANIMLNLQPIDDAILFLIPMGKAPNLGNVSNPSLGTA